MQLDSPLRSWPPKGRAQDMSAYTTAEMGYVCGTMLLGAIVNSVSQLDLPYPAVNLATGRALGIAASTPQSTDHPQRSHRDAHTPG